MKMSHNNLKLKCLPGGLIIDNFIKGIGNYSYEDYLLEFVNESAFFLKKSCNQKHIKPTSEANGECDCISDLYEMDFKLCISSSKAQAKSVFDPMIVCEEGWTKFRGSKIDFSNKGYKPIQAIRIFAALRGFGLEDFERIKTDPNGDAEEEIRGLIEKVETNKNLLLFFPYYFYFDENTDDVYGLDLIVQGLYDDFHKIFQYRSEKKPDYETFFCFLYMEKLIISEWKNKRLIVVDELSFEKSNLFMFLLDKYILLN